MTTTPPAAPHKQVLDLCDWDNNPCYAGIGDDAHWRCGTVQCPRPAAPQPPIETCPKCGAQGVAFICDTPECPVNGGAAYGPAAPQPGDAERLTEIDNKITARRANLGGWMLSHSDGVFLREQIDARDAEITRLRAEITNYMARDAAENSTAIGPDGLRDHERARNLCDLLDDECPTPALLASATLLRSLTPARQPEASGEDVERISRILDHYLPDQLMGDPRLACDLVEYVTAARRAGAEAMREKVVQLVELWIERQGAKDRDWLRVRLVEPIRALPTDVSK